jgi:hypothetical protein
VTYATPDFALIKLAGVKNNTIQSPRYLMVEEAMQGAEFHVVRAQSSETVTNTALLTL